MKPVLLIIYMLLLAIPLPVHLVAATASPKDDPSSSPGGRTYADHSVLASGTWYKIAVAESGICRISFSQLQSMGVNMATLDPRNVRLYGNGGGMLPESNKVFRYDDLMENAIEVVGEEDGIFDVADYILFYAQGPVTWTFNNVQKTWEHKIHVYSDSAYYFLSTGGQTRGKRIQAMNSVPGIPSQEVNSYDFRTYHDKDLTNLIKSGRMWFGETFDISTSHTFSFDVPEMVPGSDLVVKTVTAARATSNSYFNCKLGENTWQIQHSPISTYYNSPYASSGTSTKTFTAPSGRLEMQMQYVKPTTTALGWLDYIEINARASLGFSEGQMTFRDMSSVGDKMVSRFRLAGAAGKAQVWDVTDRLNVKRVNASIEGSDVVFTLNTDTLREFAAFDVTELIVPRFVSRVQNQDLHALSGLDMVIVSPPVFFDQAVRLATYHNTVDDLNTLVIQPEAIYNEFSSGTPDVIAIRDFLKMLYDRAGASGKPRYLLLFSDGSYDNKDRLPENSNFLLTWQTTESFDPVRSGVSDDYYGILDDNEGSTYSDKIDIGIGRLPVTTLEEATAMVDKIIRYEEDKQNTMGDWRNVIAFIADDEDGNEHVIQADNMANYLEESFQDFNVDKIYMDAYFQESTTAGARYPDVNKAITQRVEKGCLILNYTGHGGETGWAHEQVLEVKDITAWSNNYNLPVFVTATCEFSRFDDPGRTSAGEQVFLNPRGGGIALFTTTRPTYGSPNFELNRSLYKYALSPAQNSKPRLGDIMREAKRESGSDENGRKFILFGDPAQAIAFPEMKVVTTSVNGREITSSPDTLSAYAEVNVTGVITDRSGNLLADFNGLVFPTVFDKPVEQHTLGNDGGSTFTFSLQKSILYRGKVQVKDGHFNFTFIVPRDIAYRYDFGKLSYYATDGSRDATGSYSNLVIGGSAGNSASDTEGPEIALYMNDEHFTDGGITDENPWLFAIVSDENGINTIGSGIGHDLTAVLDGNHANPYILNEFYEADVDTYRSGKVRFPFSKLEPGEHEVTLKVWDIYNNSSEATIRFMVRGSDEFVIQNPRNYPNPFSASTDLVFEHNMQGDEVEVQIDIYTLTGQLVCSLQQTALESGTLSTPVRWNGINSTGGKCSPGIYLYAIHAKSSSGLEARGNGKLILAL